MLFSFILTFGMVDYVRIRLKTFLYFLFVLLGDKKGKMEQIFFQFAFMLVIAFIASYFLRALRQPIVVGYILGGMIIAYFLGAGFVNLEDSKNIINLFSNFGIAFLLFVVGLHLNPRVIKEIGTASILVGLGQMAITFILSFLISYYLLGFEILSSVYIGIALMFSSTIIAMKLLSDKNNINALFGKISIGVLIIQDIVAIFILMLISSLSNGTSLSSFALKSVLGGIGLIIVLFLFGYFLLDKFLDSIAKSQELLFLFSICWCFLIGTLFWFLGFSIEIGALIAGVVLSLSPYSIEMGSKVRPLRDFFLILFFIILGLNMGLQNIGGIIIIALILSVVALILKPVIIMSLMALFGYTKKTNFLVGTTLSQISEFSLIILALGLSFRHITNELFSTIALTLVITIILSTYIVIYSKPIYDKLRGLLNTFEKKNIKERREIKKNYHALLFGYNRIGFSILNSLKAIKKDYLVIDYNPDTIKNLSKFKIPCLYGDLDDVDLLSDIPLYNIDLAVSTIPDFDTNSLLIQAIREVNKKAIIIVRAHQIQEALDLYKKGASYVLTPHFLGGEYVGDMIRELKVDGKGYEKEKEKHLKMLLDRIKEGQEHPKVERD